MLYYIICAAGKNVGIGYNAAWFPFVAILDVVRRYLIDRARDVVFSEGDRSCAKNASSKTSFWFVNDSARRNKEDPVYMIYVPRAIHELY